MATEPQIRRKVPRKGLQTDKGPSAKRQPDTDRVQNPREVRRLLFAGGNRIRTDGPSRAERRVLFDDHYSYPNVSPNPGAVCVDRSAGRHNQSLHSDKMKRSMVVDDAARITVNWISRSGHLSSWPI
jgi:hypothetical protein